MNIIEAISQVGFPIIVTLYLLYVQTQLIHRFDYIIKEMLELIENKKK